MLAWLITRSLTQPLARATKAAEAIANGQLGNDVQTQAKDETGRLLRAMQGMQTQLQSLLTAQGDMAKRHDEGQTSFRMDAHAFPGDYGRMAEDTNALVASHLAVQSNLARIMGRYAIGDLSESMERLPGEKAVLSQTMDEVKANLSAMNIEIKQLAQSAANGDFTARGDADRFQYDFRVMVESLNLLMATADGNLQSLSSLLQSIAAGDLTARMTGDFKGCSLGCATTPTPRLRSLQRSSGASSNRRCRSIRPPARLPQATKIYRSAPSNRRPTLRRRRPRWKS